MTLVSGVLQDKVPYEQPAFNRLIGAHTLKARAGCDASQAGQAHCSGGRAVEKAAASNMSSCYLFHMSFSFVDQNLSQQHVIMSLPRSTRSGRRLATLRRGVPPAAGWPASLTGCGRVRCDVALIPWTRGLVFYQMITVTHVSEFNESANP